MPTELEQKFYDTFGIEPEFGYWCKRFDETSIADCNGIKEPSKKCAKCENGYIKYRYYPVITAEKLLQMICILNSIYDCGFKNNTSLASKEVKYLKMEILKYCILHKEQIKTQIQQLFKD